MNTYNHCTTWRTGLYKPHTIDIGGRKASIVYWSKGLLKPGYELIAMAIDAYGNKYEIYSNGDGQLAFPVNPDAINGFYGWL